jgi:hypothetical protein
MTVPLSRSLPIKTLSLKGFIHTNYICLSYWIRQSNLSCLVMSQKLSVIILIFFQLCCEEAGIFGYGHPETTWGDLLYVSGCVVGDGR